MGKIMLKARIIKKVKIGHLFKRIIMALCRCKEKHSNPKGRKKVYVKDVKPLNYDKTSSICGIKDCENAGMIWLTEEELIQYNSGVKIFSYASGVCKVKVE